MATGAVAFPDEPEEEVWHPINKSRAANPSALGLERNGLVIIISLIYGWTRTVNGAISMEEPR